MEKRMEYIHLFRTIENNNAPLIGWIGGAGYLISLFIMIVGHVQITKTEQLKILLLWLGIDIVIYAIRYGSRALRHVN